MTGATSIAKQFYLVQPIWLKLSYVNQLTSSSTLYFLKYRRSIDSRRQDDESFYPASLYDTVSSLLLYKIALFMRSEKLTTIGGLRRLFLLNNGFIDGAYNNETEVSFPIKFFLTATRHGLRLGESDRPSNDWYLN